MTTKSTASEIIEKVDGAAAISFEGGYAMFLDKPRVLFEPARCIKQRRNEAGRCTYFLGEYKDGSRIEFKFHPSHPTVMKVINP